MVVQQPGEEALDLVQIGAVTRLANGLGLLQACQQRLGLGLAAGFAAAQFLWWAFGVTR